jgi:hypothetical protein
MVADVSRMADTSFCVERSASGATDRENPSRMQACNRQRLQLLSTDRSVKYVATEQMHA